MTASIRCKNNKHCNATITANGFRCDGFAYPGALTAPPVPCQCYCHRDEKREPEENPT